MSQEIERKFLVKNTAFRQEAVERIHIVQGYLNRDPQRTVRVRLWAERGYITVKGIGNASGASRFEWEKEIPADDAKALLEIAEPGVIDKTRYIVRCPDGVHTWEVDEFHASHEGLCVAEIELSDENETFPKPEWLGEEVTGNPKYYNSAL